MGHNLRMDPLPTGTVTMLFSDIEGSTALLRRLGDSYGEALSGQRRIMRAAIGAHSGWEMGTEGDSFFVVFESANHAIGACLQAQRRLATFDWPEGEAVRVRMGVHTGHPSRLEEGYVGMDLNRAARISAAAHGGQVVISGATEELVTSGLPDAVELVDLGWHRLKDIDQPEHIFQLTAPDLPADFPRLKTLGSQSNFPTQATPLVGRDSEIRDLQSVVLRAGVRLVTLTGPGGVGKTRAALALAASLDTAFRDGVYFVPLATVNEASAMWKALADVVGVNSEVGLEQAVPEFLAGRVALLVLDNLEQIDDAASVIGALLTGASRLVVMATSRRPVHLQGEREFPVPPLAGPNGPALEDIAASGAVRLFLQQAQLVRPGFELTSANAGEVVAICHRLDGLPLAIELAASRLKLLTPRSLLSRLGKSLDLAATDLDRPSRHQTLRDTIAWSHDLLTADLQRVFRRAGVFTGGCDLDALEFVAMESAETVEGGDSLEAVAELLDVSLVTVTGTREGDTRVAMLETIREYAVGQLEQAEELESTRRRHADYYANFAEKASAELHGSRQLMWVDRIEVEHDNLRAALSWTLEGGPRGNPDDGERRACGLRLVNALSFFWYAHDVADGRRWLEFAVAQGDEDDGPALADAMHGLGWVLQQQGETERALPMLERNLALCRDLRDPIRLAKALNVLGMAHRHLGQLDAARRRLEESLEIARRYPDDDLLGNVLNHLAIVALDSDEPERATILQREQIAFTIKKGDTFALAMGRLNLAAAIGRCGRPVEAQGLLCSLLEDASVFGDLHVIASTLDELAEAALALTLDVRAARLLGAADRLHEQIRIPRSAPDALHLDRSVGPARDRVGHDAWEAEMGWGRQLTQDEAIAFARQPQEPQGMDAGAL
jgi:predicted ATPase/class 3 adenylate cyclase